MELDQMKTQWQQTNVSPKNKNTMELIQQPGYGPLAKLKRSFLRQMRLMIIFPFFLLFVSADDYHVVLGSVLFWAYVALCIGVATFCFLNYRLIDKMESPTGNVKESLQHSLATLETRLKYKLNVMPFALLILMALLEILPFYQHFRMLDKWHALPVWTRIGIYAGFLVFQYFMSRAVSQRKFGRHLARLRELLARMEEV